MNKPTPLQFLLFVMAALITYFVVVPSPTNKPAPLTPVKPLDSYPVLNFDLK
jgi:hypothetical protein